MKLSTTQFNTLIDETRNAAVDIHYARLAFIDSNVTPEETDARRAKLIAARDVYTDKMLAIQNHIVDDLIINRVDGELLMPLPMHEDLIDAPKADKEVHSTDPTPTPVAATPAPLASDTPTA